MQKPVCPKTSSTNTYKQKDGTPETDTNTEMAHFEMKKIKSRTRQMALFFFGAMLHCLNIQSPIQQHTNQTHPYVHTYTRVCINMYKHI